MVKVDAAEMARTIAASGRIALYGILFDFDKATLKPESAPALTEIAALLKSDTKLKLLVVGHTDNAGAFDYNRDQSQHRADPGTQLRLTAASLPFRCCSLTTLPSARTGETVRTGGANPGRLADGRNPVSPSRFDPSRRSPRSTGDPARRDLAAALSVWSANRRFGY